MTFPAAMLCLLLAGTSCGGGGPSRAATLERAAFPGADLGRFNTIRRGATYGLRRGEQYVALLIPLRSASRRPLRLERVELRGVEGAPHVAEARAVEVQPIRLTPNESGGIFELGPRHDAMCPPRPVRPLPGHVIRRGLAGAAWLVLRVAIHRAGTFVIESQRVYYRRGQTRFYQDVPYTITLHVAADAPANERRDCISLAAP